MVGITSMGSWPMRDDDGVLVLTSFQSVDQVLQEIFGLRPADPKPREDTIAAPFMGMGFYFLSRTLNINHPPIEKGT
jgi:hypothetical protein